MTTKNDISQILAILTTTYPNLTFSDPAAALAIWHEILQDIPAADLRRAVLALVSQPREFAPNPGQIRAEWVRLTAQDNGTPDAATAWGQLLAYRRVTSRVYCAEALRLAQAYGDARSGREWVDATHAYRAHLDHCQDCGEQTSETDLNPLVRRVAVSLGWPANFPGSADDQIADRAHFLRAYESARADCLRDAAIMPAAQQAAPRIAAGVGQVAARLGGGAR